MKPGLQHCDTVNAVYAVYPACRGAPSPLVMCFAGISNLPTDDEGTTAWYARRIYVDTHHIHVYTRVYVYIYIFTLNGI